VEQQPVSGSFGFRARFGHGQRSRWHSSECAGTAGAHSVSSAALRKGLSTACPLPKLLSSNPCARPEPVEDDLVDFVSAMPPDELRRLTAGAPREVSTR